MLGIQSKTDLDLRLTRIVILPISNIDSNNIADIFSDGVLAQEFTIEDIGDGDIQSGMLADAAVTTAKLANLSVDVNKLANLSVEASKLANSSVTSTKIANLAVGSAAIAALAVGTAHIANGAILNAKIGDGEINNAKIANATIDTAKIANLNADLINAGTIVGRTLKANGGSGVDVWVSNNGVIYFRYGGDSKAYLQCDSGGNLTIDADNLLYLRASGTGDDVYLQAGDGTFFTCNNDHVFSGRDILFSMTRDFYVTCDDFIIAYNDDNDGSDCFFSSNGNLRMKIDQSGDVTADGSFTGGGADFAEMFENLSLGIIPIGTSVCLEGDKVREAKENDEPIGVVSINPTIVGNNGAQDAGTQWKDKYLVDDYGAYVMEEKEFYTAFIMTEKSKKESGQEIPSMKKKISGWSDIDPIPVNAFDIQKKMCMRNVVNPEFNPDIEFISRDERPNEWSTIGLLGRLWIRKGQVISKNWIKLREVNTLFDEYLIK